MAQFNNLKLFLKRIMNNKHNLYIKWLKGPWLSPIDKI